MTGEDQIALKSRRIEEFLSSYRREVFFYQSLVVSYKDYLHELMQASGIKAIVSGRAKDPESLRRKLERRNVSANYASDEAIRADLRDLAGIRIALYFPSDRKAVEDIIKKAFGPVGWKQFPENHAYRTGKVYDGYHADHYQIECRVSSNDPAGVFKGASLEVQVGSVLMHAWSEVEHDLEYKEEYGAVSATESQLLDELNGLVLRGETILDDLGNARRERLYRDRLRNSDHLRGMVEVLTEGLSVEVNLGDVDSLWYLLRSAGAASEPDVRSLMKGMQFESQKRSVAENVAFRFLLLNPAKRPANDELTRLERLWNAGLPRLLLMADELCISDAQLATDYDSVVGRLPVSNQARRALINSRELLNKAIFKPNIHGVDPFSRIPEEIDDVEQGLVEVANS